LTEASGLRSNPGACQARGALTVEKAISMSGDELAMRRRRALYRATHRGNKELDFLLGRFAVKEIATMTAPEIAVLERLIETPDPDIAMSLFEGNSLGETELDGLMQRVRQFHGVIVQPRLANGS
jgi:antitoxin CptB